MSLIFSPVNELNQQIIIKIVPIFTDPHFFLFYQQPLLYTLRSKNRCRWVEYTTAPVPLQRLRRFIRKRVHMRVLAFTSSGSIPASAQQSSA